MPQFTPPCSQPARTWTRRAVLLSTTTTAVTALLAACGDAAAPTPTSLAPTSSVAPVVRTSVSTSAPAPTATVVGTATTTAAIASTAMVATVASGVATVPPAIAPTVTRSNMQPAGELRIAVASFPNAVDALKDTNMLRFGAAETLMRLTPQYRLEPWLAERIVNLDPTTWRVTLRPNAKFHDGSPVTAADVVAAFGRNFAVYPNANGLIRKDTVITAVDMLTVEFKTPEPSGAFPNFLASSNFIIHKPTSPGGTDGTLLTGPYRPTQFMVDNSLTLVPFADHWAGPPPIARITLKKVVDPNTEVLALQSHDTDLIYRVPVDVVQGLSGDFTVSAIPSAIVDSINLNFAHPPFDDRAVREATAWGIDREAFVKVALGGQGAAATGVFPAGLGPEVVAVQGTDLARSRRLLDDAGWKPGPDGVRLKDGKRLAFTLFDGDPTQPELMAMAVTIQSQLKPLGYDVGIQLAQESGTAQKNGTFDALLRSSNSVQTGDPLFQLNRTYGTGGVSNTGGYRNPQVDMLLVQLRGELDPAQRQALSRQIQQIGGSDVPHIFLAVVPLVTAYRKGKLANFAPHPDDTYLIDRNWAVT